MERVLVNEDVSRLNGDIQSYCHPIPYIQKPVDIFNSMGFGKVKTVELHDLFNNTREYVFNKSKPSKELLNIPFQKDKIYDVIEKPEKLDELEEAIKLCRQKLSQMRFATVACSFDHFELNSEGVIVLSQRFLADYRESCRKYAEHPKEISLYKKLESIIELCNEIMDEVPTQKDLGLKVIFDCFNEGSPYFSKRKAVLDGEKVYALLKKIKL